MNNNKFSFTHILISSILFLLSAIPVAAQERAVALTFGPTPVISIGVDMPVKKLYIRPSVTVPFPMIVGAAVSIRGQHWLYPVATIASTRYIGGWRSQETRMLIGAGAQIYSPCEEKDCADEPNVDMIIEVGYSPQRNRYYNGYTRTRWTGWALQVGARFW